MARWCRRRARSDRSHGGCRCRWRMATFARQRPSRLAPRSARPEAPTGSDPRYPRRRETAEGPVDMTSGRRRPGDRRVRVEKVQPQAFTVKPVRRLRGAPAPATSLLLLFVVLITAGTGLLMLPLASNDGTSTRFIDALFTATSAACVTGLTVLDTATHWSPFGQVVILVLIQAGGFGIMAGSTLLLMLLVGHRTTLRDRVLMQESFGGL